MADPARVNVTLALPIAGELEAMVRAVDPRLAVAALSRAQRRVWREGRPLWAGYPEPPQPEDESEDEAKVRLAEILAATEVILSNPVVPADVAERAPQLRWLQLTSAGVDRLLDAPVVRSHVAVTTASGIHAAPISEYVLGSMIAFAKGFPRLMRAQQEHAWRPFWPQELEGKTAGIIGLGPIGRRTAVLCHALGMRVLAMRRSATARAEGAAAGVEGVDTLLPPSDLAYLLAESDYVVLAAPLTPESRGMIGQAQLAAMKQTAVIINIGRGPLIEEAALIRALKDGRLAGAALDVFDHEPLPPESELWGLENVLLTPHISGGTPRYMERAVELFCDNLRRYLAGETLRNIVDPARGY